jgi:hypothetical protein
MLLDQAVFVRERSHQPFVAEVGLVVHVNRHKLLHELVAPEVEVSGVGFQVSDASDVRH